MLKEPLSTTGRAAQHLEGVPFLDEDNLRIQGYPFLDKSQRTDSRLEFHFVHGRHLAQRTEPNLIHVAFDAADLALVPSIGVLV